MWAHKHIFTFATIVLDCRQNSIQFIDQPQVFESGQRYTRNICIENLKNFILKSIEETFR